MLVTFHIVPHKRTYPTFGLFASGLNNINNFSPESQTASLMLFLYAINGCDLTQGGIICLTGSLNENWGVIYPPSTCVIKGSTVSFPCTYTYPSGTVAKMFWCKDPGYCDKPPYVYDSNNKTIGTNEFIYIGDKKNNCTLQIRNINDTHSGEYRFRFVTDNPQEKWTGSPGMSIQVTGERNSIMIGSCLKKILIINT